nr:hypothetical protein Iba_chr01cCG8580 [Ipomoea batatas]
MDDDVNVQSYQDVTDLKVNEVRGRMGKFLNVVPRWSLMPGMQIWILNPPLSHRKPRTVWMWPADPQTSHNLAASSVLLHSPTARRERNRSDRMEMKTRHDAEPSRSLPFHSHRRNTEPEIADNICSRSKQRPSSWPSSTLEDSSAGAASNHAKPIRRSPTTGANSFTPSPTAAALITALTRRQICISGFAQKQTGEGGGDVGSSYTVGHLRNGEAVNPVRYLAFFVSSHVLHDAESYG